MRLHVPLSTPRMFFIPCIIITKKRMGGWHYGRDAVGCVSTIMPIHQSIEGTSHALRPTRRQFLSWDRMPLWHDGIFHLYYLRDEGHHQGLGGLGGHQWAHATSNDLVHWHHHPLALAIDADWEGSICTGSVFVHDGTFHAFHATRKPDWSQHLGHAVSNDGITFHKTTPNPFAAPPPHYSVNDYRDPFVYQDDQQLFHMLVSSKQLDYPLAQRGAVCSN
jgi:hypothetical protein